jgi:hypothetical protein
MERIYEVFVSSTYQDLKAERLIIREFIIHHGNIPVGMEEFISGGRPPWHHIEKAISNCDFYVLIVGGRYGALNPNSSEGLSYTECEYDFARKLGKEMLTFILSDEAVQTSLPEKRDKIKSNRAKLDRFRERLMSENLVLFWESREDFERKLSEITRWIKTHSLETGGWVRAKELATAHHELEKEKAHKYVFTYLFNRLNPYENVTLTLQFLRDLHDQLDNIECVLRVLERFIEIYVNRLIEGHIRVYFAYSLNPSHLVKEKEEEVPNELAYRLGISNSKDGKWQQGKVLRGPSNIHNVYQKRQRLGIEDSTRKPTKPDVLNVPVKDEGSVIAAPVYGPSHDYSIGVVGLNSPQKGEALEHYDLIRELGILFSSLFYAYSRQLKQERGRKKADNIIVYQIRNEIVDYFNDILGEPSELIEET